MLCFLFYAMIMKYKGVKMTYLVLFVFILLLTLLCIISNENNVVCGSPDDHRMSQHSHKITSMSERMTQNISTPDTLGESQTICSKKYTPPYM